MVTYQGLAQPFAGSRFSIGAKLTLLAAVAVAAFIIPALAESIVVREIRDKAEAEEIARRVHRARRLLARQAENKANLVSEFSFWDDTWDMVDQPGSAASQDHLRENFLEWLPQRYDDRLIEIWNKERELVWRWMDSSRIGTGPEIDRTFVFNRVETERLSAGYVRASKGLMLLGTALVLHESDQTLQGPSNGFLITAEPLDSARISAMEDELQEELAILPFPSEWASDSIGTEVRGDSLEARFALAGFNGRPVALVSLTSLRSPIQKLAPSMSLVVLATMGIGIMVLALLWRMGNRLVVRPLGEIGGALETMEREGRLAPLETSVPAREWALFVGAFNRMIDALKSSERRYRVLFDHSADAQFLLDSGTQVVLEANPAAEAVAGLQRGEMIGRPLSDVVRLDPSPTGDGTFRIKRADGTTLTVGVVSAELEIGGAPRQLASLRDLTSTEALSAQLRQAQKMEAIGSLAGGIAHDFNNLLGAVIMASSTLKEETAGDPALQASLETIDQASRRAAELTRRLLSFARPEHRSTGTVSINDVVQNVVRLCERTFDRAIRLEVELAGTLPAVSGDGGQLEQVLLNLCINSRDAMPSGGLIRVGTRASQVDAAQAARLRDVQSGDYVVISVRDSGFGLTVAAEQHLFEPFFTTKGPGKGTGLGLAMVYGLIRAHGGGIQVHNHPGEGVEFEIYLPAASGRVVEVSPTLARLPARGTEHVLIIDDEAALRKSMSRALSRLGYQVEVADNGSCGARMVEQAPWVYDLVILDMMMPEMGGVETFERIRGIRPDLKVLLCSGYSSDGERGELLKEEATGFLEKPFDTAELAAAVRGILDR
jgi:signal transduction histidine kinase/sensor domain CHASE-containing protein